MDDLERAENESASSLTRLGISAIGYTVGGLLLFVLQMVARFRVVGMLIGLALCVFGIVSLLSKDPADRRPGAVITGAGVLTLLSKVSIPIVQAVSGTLLSIGAFGLLYFGLRNGIRFLINLKRRS